MEGGDSRPWEVKGPREPSGVPGTKLWSAQYQVNTLLDAILLEPLSTCISFSRWIFNSQELLQIVEPMTNEWKTP